jgi:putative ABC transport system permease protein
VLSSRPGLSGSGVQLTYGGGGGKGGGQLVGPGSGGGGPGPGGPGAGGPGPGNTNNCSPGSCIAHPVVLEESQLPTGTDAPNTLITQSALRRLHFANQSSLDGWIIQADSPITSAQILNAQAAAATNNLSIESKNDAPTSSEIVNGATVFGIALALGILAMSIGLIRSETASELRTLTATGASSRTRRTLTAVTAGGLAFLGALLGTVAAYVGLAGWFHSNALEGGVSDIIHHIPWSNLSLIVIVMPAVAAIVGWVLAGRDPTGISTRPME